MIAFSRLVSNYKMRGKTWKKEVEYYDRKINQVDEVWKEFDNKDNRMRELDNDISHEYYVENFYDRANDYG